MDKKVSTFRIISVLLGIVCLATNIRAQSDVPDDDVSRESIKFVEIYSVLEKNYMNEINPDQVILEGGIRGMLYTLDPFSAFFNPDQFQMLKEQTRGNTLGFGSILYVSPGKVVVLQAAENSPSWRAGLGPGDEIVSVNGERVSSLDFESLIDLLRRSRSQPVSLGIVHPGKIVAEDIKLVPAEVALPSVDKAFLFKSGIAYLHISGFEQNTPSEVSDSIARLGGASLKGVLLDLRDNHGGLVNSAVATASLFLKPDVLILTEKGRSTPANVFKTPTAPVHFEIPLIVLVNENTASAAEILAAALEEHDRGLLVGEPTFGKGVVESVGTLSEKCGLALTTGQYFTPSGRSIQRPLPGTALAAAVDPEQAQADSHDAEPKASFRTDAGRPLMAGGGITPDVELPRIEPDPWLSFLNQRGLITSFASYFLTLHGKVTQSFEPDQSTLDDFRQFLTRQGIRSPDEFWGPDQNELKLRIKSEIFNLVFGLDSGDEVAVKGDPQVQQAATYFGKAGVLLKAAPANPNAAISREAQK